MNESPKHQTIDQVARRWAVHRQTIVRLIASGKLRAIRVGRAWRVTEAEVQRYELEAGHQPGA